MEDSEFVRNFITDLFVEFPRVSPSHLVLLKVVFGEVLPPFIRTQSEPLNFLEAVLGWSLVHADELHTLKHFQLLKHWWVIVSHSQQYNPFECRGPSFCSGENCSRDSCVLDVHSSLNKGTENLGECDGGVCTLDI